MMACASSRAARTSEVFGGTQVTLKFATRFEQGNAIRGQIRGNEDILLAQAKRPFLSNASITVYKLLNIWSLTSAKSDKRRMRKVGHGEAGHAGRQRRLCTETTVFQCQTALRRNTKLPGGVQINVGRRFAPLHEFG